MFKKTGIILISMMTVIGASAESQHELMLVNKSNEPILFNIFNHDQFILAENIFLQSLAQNSEKKQKEGGKVIVSWKDGDKLKGISLNMDEAPFIVKFDQNKQPSIQKKEFPCNKTLKDFPIITIPGAFKSEKQFVRLLTRIISVENKSKETVQFAIFSHESKKEPPLITLNPEEKMQKKLPSKDVVIVKVMVPGKGVAYSQVAAGNFNVPLLYLGNGKWNTMPGFERLKEYVKPVAPKLPVKLLMPEIQEEEAPVVQEVS